MTGFGTGIAMRAADLARLDAPIVRKRQICFAVYLITGEELAIGELFY